MLHRSTLQLLRFSFSFFLMPIYWFSVSFISEADISRAIAVFIILHFLVYPSSNGYNSYMDRDEESIGGIKHPMQPTRQLFWVTILMDTMAILMSAFISGVFAACIAIYIFFSRLYSYRGVRLKKYPITGYLTVVINQGALTFFMIYHGVDENLTTHMPLLIMVASAFLIGGFYPITQIYQHNSDLKDGITTISMKAGKKGTFILCGVMYAFAMLLLWFYYSARELYLNFFVLITYFLPVIVYFIWWFLKVVKDESAANFKNTMRMNWIASTCTNLAFITIILIQRFG